MLEIASHWIVTATDDAFCNFRVKFLNLGCRSFASSLPWKPYRPWPRGWTQESLLPPPSTPPASSEWVRVRVAAKFHSKLPHLSLPPFTILALYQASGLCNLSIRIASLTVLGVQIHFPNRWATLYFILIYQYYSVSLN